MEILFVSPGSLYSEKRPFKRLGSESQIYGISKEMIKQGHDVYVMGRFDNFKGKEYETIDDIQFINIRTPHLKDESIHQIGSALLYSRAAAKKIKQINPDAISLTERFSAYFPSKLDIPKTFTVHNYDAMPFYRTFACNYNKLNYLFFDIKRKLEGQVMHCSDIIIPLNKSFKDYLHEYGFTNTYIIPNAVNIKEYSNKGDDSFVLYTGRLNKVKGLDCLIRAFFEISNEYSNYELVLTGTGPDEKRLKEMVTSLNIKSKVHFTSWLETKKLREYLSKCSVFVLPSLFECMPVALLEALASGKPVIASDIPGPKDIITHGYDGFLFEKENVDELKKYLELCFSDEKLRREIGKNARKTVEEKYTFNKISTQYLELYEGILCQT